MFTPLVGGVEKEDLKTGHVAALMRKDSACTTFHEGADRLDALRDYIRRAMPWNAPKSLSDDESTGQHGLPFVTPDISAERLRAERSHLSATSRRSCPIATAMTFDLR